MPIHDWMRVNAGLFHHFHHGWTVALADHLNAGRLPAGNYALLERSTWNLVQGVAAVDGQTQQLKWFVTSADEDVYAARADRIAIRQPLGQVVAIIEIVSPGNKHSRTALRAFVEKSVEFLRQGIHLLVVDLFPPSPHDPQGIHKAIWDEIKEEPFDLPTDKLLTVSAYCAGVPATAYIEPVAVGDFLPAAPIFLDAEAWVPAPLEESYSITWDNCPLPLKEAVAGTAKRRDGD